MARARGLVRKAGVAEPQSRAVAMRMELDGHHGLRPFSPRLRHPGHLDEARGLELQEPSVVRVAIALKTRLEEKGCVDLRLHGDGASRREPPVELPGPGP